MRRYTRLTKGHSKKVANVALYTMFYNFIRTHSKLRMAIGRDAATLCHADLFDWLGQRFAPGQDQPRKRNFTGLCCITADRHIAVFT
jgi:hypothetical protein